MDTNYVTLRFQRNAKDILTNLQMESDFCDVMIGCNNSDGRYLQAHKIILASCSSVLKEMLKESVLPHNTNTMMIYLRGFQYDDLSSMLDFMYQGEVNIEQTNLGSFLSLAEDLKIEGLYKNMEKNKYLNTCSDLSVLDRLERFCKTNDKIIENNNVTLTKKETARLMDVPDLIDLFNANDKLIVDCEIDTKDIQDSFSELKEDKRNLQLEQLKIKNQFYHKKPNNLSDNIQIKLKKKDWSQQIDPKVGANGVDEKKCLFGEMLPSSGRGRKVLMLEGFKYVLHKIVDKTKKKRKIFWRCWRKECRTIIQTNLFDIHKQQHPNIQLLHRNEHNHLNDLKVIEKTRFIKRLMEHVTGNPLMKSRDMYDNTVAEHEKESTNIDEIPSYESVRTRIRRAVRSIQSPFFDHFESTQNYIANNY